LFARRAETHCSLPFRQVSGVERAAFVFVADIRVSVFREKHFDYSDVAIVDSYPLLSRPVVGPRLDVCAFVD
jgi:hypothetical protein